MPLQELIGGEIALEILPVAESSWQVESSDGGVKAVAEERGARFFLEATLEPSVLNLRLSHVGPTDMVAGVLIPLRKGMEIAARVRHPEGQLPEGFAYTAQRELRGAVCEATDLRCTSFPSPLTGEISIGERRVSYRCANEENCWQLRARHGAQPELILWTASNPDKPILSVNSLDITIQRELSGR